jgi:hypothetical protein
MTTYRVYLGETGPGDALDWAGAFATGNVPHRVGPEFPLVDSGSWSRMYRILETSLHGVRVDWGAIAARVGVDQLRWFLDQAYGAAIPAELTDLLTRLDPERSYALVALEH